MFCKVRNILLWAKNFMHPFNRTNGELKSSTNIKFVF